MASTNKYLCKPLLLREPLILNVTLASLFNVQPDKLQCPTICGLSVRPQITINKTCFATPSPIIWRAVKPKALPTA